jgi:hypothetical protein
VQRPTTVDHTIVVRAWVEPTDPTPRARLVAVGLDREVTAYGSTEIERAFSRLLRELVDPDDRSDAS